MRNDYSEYGKHNEYREYLAKVLKLRNKNLYWIIFGAVSMCVILAIIMHIPLQDIVVNCFTTILVSLIVILIFDFYYRRQTQQDHDAYIKEMIIDLLQAKDYDHSIINILYKDEAVERVLSNCIKHYCIELSNVYPIYILRNLSVIRSNLSYDIRIQCKDQHCLMLSQMVEYTRKFRYAGQYDGSQVKLRCFFSFTKNLDKEFADNSFFFREVLSYQPLVDKIIERIKNNDIQSVYDDLSLDIRFNKCYEVKKNDIHFSCKTNDDGQKIVGILAEINIDPSLISFDDQYMSYTASVNCLYPVENQDIFYFAFTDPTIGDTKLSIDFCDNIISDPDQIGSISLMSLSEDKIYVNSQKSGHNTIRLTMSTHDTILPRSGYVVYWNCQH